MRPRVVVVLQEQRQGSHTSPRALRLEPAKAFDAKGLDEAFDLVQGRTVRPDQPITRCPRSAGPV